MTPFKAFLAVLLSLSFIASPVAAQTSAGYPNKTITLVVPWPPGGLTDRLGRNLAQKMAKSLGVTVIVDNRAGASGLIGSEYVMRSAPDGYTLLIQSTDTLVKLMQEKGSDPVTEFTNISMLATVPLVLGSGPKFNRSTLPELIEEAKRRPGEIAYGSIGEGGALHYGMEIFSKQAGIQLLHVPYKGTAPQLTDLLGGQIELTLLSLPSVQAQISAQKIRGLAITSPNRAESAPDVPTFGELGFPQFDLALWYGIVGPKGLPEPIVRKLNTVINQALSEADIQADLKNSFAQPLAGTPGEMNAFIKTQAVKWKSIIQQ